MANTPDQLCVCGKPILAIGRRKRGTREYKTCGLPRCIAAYKYALRDAMWSRRWVDAVKDGLIRA